MKLTIVLLLILLYVISLIEPKQGTTNSSEYVKISGVVNKSYSFERLTILYLENESNKIVVFKHLNVKKGDYVIIYGRSDIYKGEKEFIGYKVYVK